MLRIGIDTGGTFTDFVALEVGTGRVSIAKVPSTPKRPSDAPLAAIRQSGVEPGQVERIVIGTTIATNARLQKKGATVLYVGTKGTEDAPVIARIDRKEAYNPAWPKPDAGVRRRHVFGITERLDHKGNVLTALNDKELRRLGDWAARWLKSDPETDWAVAVNLLYSYVSPAHEKAIGDYLAKRFPGLPVSLSHQVAPIWREYERSATTITDAFIKRVIGDFGGQLASEIKSLGIKGPLSLMKSNGGHAAAAAAGEAPVQLLLSGLAGGVIAGRRFARDHAEGNGVTLDMGGTSADVGLIANGEFGSFASTATEVFQEGLRLPPVKLMSKGEYCKDVWRVVMANHRTPDTTWGDFHAMMGSLTAAERRFQTLVAQLGLDAFERIADSLIEHGEAWMRREIRKIPNGVYEGEDYFEDDGVERRNYHFRCKVHVRDDNVVVDLSGSDPQARGPINVTYVATSAACCAGCDGSDLG